MIVDKREFKYGQWVVTIELKEDFDKVNDYYCTVDCTGNWRATQGILYDYNRPCVAFNEPELLPTGLKSRIHHYCRKLISDYRKKV